MTLPVFETLDAWHSWLSHHIKPNSSFQTLLQGKQDIELEAKISLTLLPRLQESLYEKSDKAVIHFSWSVSLTRAPFAKATLHVKNESETPLFLMCQRCMSDLSWQLDSRSSFWIAPNEERFMEAELPQEDEVFFYDEIIDFLQIIEDEALLCCPHSPRHTENQCKITPNLSEPRIKIVENSKPHPFAILAQLKKNPKES